MTTYVKYIQIWAVKHR